MVCQLFPFNNWTHQHTLREGVSSIGGNRLCVHVREKERGQGELTDFERGCLCYDRSTERKPLCTNADGGRMCVCVPHVYMHIQYVPRTHARQLQAIQFMPVSTRNRVVYARLWTFTWPSINVICVLCMCMYVSTGETLACIQKKKQVQEVVMSREIHVNDPENRYKCSMQSRSNFLCGHNVNKSEE